MNLVAKEFVASQAAENPGVLVLSRFAGAARELDGALLVNPYDIDETAHAIARGLEMPVEERVQRWRRMFSRIRAGDITYWRKSFLEDLAAVDRTAPVMAAG
jgi:trehalose 6-phosphate synthase